MKAYPTKTIPSASRVAGGGYPTPVLVTDTREKRPLCFTHLPSVSETLQTGDYSIKGFERDFSVERKSIPDLINSLTRERERFTKELHRLTGINSRGFGRLLIVGTKKELMVFLLSGALPLKRLRYGLKVALCTSTIVSLSSWGKRIKHLNGRVPLLWI